MTKDEIHGGEGDAYEGLEEEAEEHYGGVGWGGVTEEGDEGDGGEWRCWFVVVIGLSRFGGGGVDVGGSGGDFFGRLGGRGGGGRFDVVEEFGVG